MLSHRLMLVLDNENQSFLETFQREADSSKADDKTSQPRRKQKAVKNTPLPRHVPLSRFVHVVLIQDNNNVNFNG